MQPVLIDGQWRQASAEGSFRAENPATRETFVPEFPISGWDDCDAALTAAAEAARLLRDTPPESIAAFLTRYSELLEENAEEIVAMAHLETALPERPRLAEVEMARTADQLRQAAAAAIEGSWALPTLDLKNDLRSCYEPLGPVCVFGPNNFPFAYNGVCGGDFAAAVAAGNPVIAKAHPCHPETTRLIAQQALAALGQSKLPRATVQMLYHVPPEEGLRLVSDPRIGATGFTGSRAAGLKLKAAAEAAGKPIYLELSSLNPVVILPGALAGRGARIAGEFADSCLAAGGQFCTNPGIVLLFSGAETERWIAQVKERFDSVPLSPLLSAAVARGLQAGVEKLQKAGAHLVTGGRALDGPGYLFANTLLRVSGEEFLAAPKELQTEAFGSSSLLIVVRDAAEAAQVLEMLEGNLTGSIYSGTGGGDDSLYAALAPLLRARVGRFLNDKMPTGVIVSPAMNHGGPYPATGHPGFTAVGIPASMRRFARLACYDHVRAARLPPLLRDENPHGRAWRLIEGRWTRGNVGA